MTESVLDRAAEQIAGTSNKVSEASCAIAEALGNSVGAARRVAKHGGDAAEEFIDDTTRRLQRHPVETVVMTLALGIAVGALISWIVKRR